MSNYIVTVKYGDSLNRSELTKRYLIEGVGSQYAAKRKFIELHGYDPGVPINAEVAGMFRLDQVEILR